MNTDLHEAVARLAELVERAANGEEIVITSGGTPRARLVAYESPAPRAPGSLRGKVELADDFDHSSDDLLDAFEGM